MAWDRLTLSDVEAAAQRLLGLIVETPIVPCPGLEGVFLKLESFQPTGSFKVRGALNAMALMDDATLARGVSSVSAGNHGLGVAYAAKRRGVRARVYVPQNAVERKVSAMRALGAEVEHRPHEVLGSFLARMDAGDGTVFLAPFADARIAAGAGTIGSEIARQVPGVRTVVVPVGGGGIAWGVSTALLGLLPHARVYGATAERAPAVAHAWRTGRAEPVKATSVADGLNAPLASPHVVEALKRQLGGLLTVSEDEICHAMRSLALDAKVVAEGAGAAAFAAALANPDLPRPIVVVVTGGNVDPAVLREILGTTVSVAPGA